VGIEYRHFLVVNDETWLPKPDTIAGVEAALRKWSLVEELKQVLDLSHFSNGEPTEIDHARAKGDPGHGLALFFGGILGQPVVNIAGAALHNGISDAERYTMGVALVVGCDYRVHWSSEGLYFELVAPPRQGRDPIIPYPVDYVPEILYAQSFPCDGNTSPPQVKIHVADHAETNFGRSNYQGFWRGAVVINFGKNLPAFVQDLHALPNQDFVDAIEEAFHAEIAEIGEFF
jgi:hypothetical protein